MARQDLIESFTTEAYRVLSSYPLSGKIVVMYAGTYGVGLAIARACIMARVSDMILVGPNEHCLQKTMDTLVALAVVPTPQEVVQPALAFVHEHESVVHRFTAKSMDPDAITSTFLSIHETIGIPDVLILQNASRGHDNHILESTAAKSLFEYTTSDVQKCLYFNEGSKIAVVRRFLAPGTKRRKSLINVAVVGGSHDPSEAEDPTHFLAHAKKLYGGWTFTVHELLSGTVSTRLLTGATNGTGWMWDDGEFSFQFLTS